MKPDISVVMTAYNGEKFIAQAVDSILNQTFKNFEFIIVDDYSSDQTYKIISSYQDPRIQLIRNKENLGQTKSLNIALEQSEGEFIARMDADDVSCPERLAVQYEYLKNNPHIAVVGTWCKDINENGKFIRTYKVPCDSLIIKMFLAVSGDLTVWCLSHPTVLMRREALEAVGFYTERPNTNKGHPQDYDLWMKLARGYQLANIPQALLKYRILFNSDSRLYPKKQLDARFEITKDKIHYYLPSLKEDQLYSLARMIEYYPQEDKMAGEKILDLFEAYFEAYTAYEFKKHSLIKKYKEKIKLYYLPQLFLTNKRLSIRHFLKIISQYPAFFFDPRFYRKVIKVFLMRTLREEKFIYLVKKVFSYR